MKYLKRFIGLFLMLVVLSILVTTWAWLDPRNPAPLTVFWQCLAGSCLVVGVLGLARLATWFWDEGGRA